LLSAVPRLDGGTERLEGIPGSVPNPAELPGGCPFHPRCARAADTCRSAEPEVEPVAEGHWVKCHFWNE